MKVHADALRIFSGPRDPTDIPITLMSQSLSIPRTRLATVAGEFNYENRCRNCRGKLWHETYPEAFAPYTGFALHKLERIEALVAPGRAVLDIGCGLGDALHLLRDRFEELHGLDPSEAMVATARDNLTDRGVKHVDIRRGLAEELPYDDGQFDTVVSTDTYEHVDPAFRAAALSEMRRVTAPGGQVILVTPSRAIITMWAVFDNLLTLPAQARAGSIRVFSSTPKSYTEIFCSKRELLGAMREAGLTIRRFERTSFYPAPERPGFAGSVCKVLHARCRPGWRAMTTLQRGVQALRILNQKMLVEATRD